MPETTHSPPQGRARRGIITAIIAVAMVALPVLFAGPASAAVPGTVAVNGLNPIDLGVKVSQATFPGAGSAGGVIVIRSDNPVDALSASALAGRLNAPILATPTGSLAPETQNEIQRVKAPGAAIYVLGGTAAVSPAVETALTALGPVQRIGGADRYDTSAQVANQIGSAGTASFGGFKTVIVANGVTFVDALASGPLAWDGHPILLSNGTSLNASVVAAFTTTGAQQAVIMGGSAVINSAVRNQVSGLVGNRVIAFAGVDRYDSAAELAQALVNVGVSPANTVLAPGVEVTGFNYYPALFGGYHAGAVNSPMVLTGSVPYYTSSFLSFNADDITQLTAVQVNALTLSKAAQIVDQGSTNVPSAPRNVRASQLIGSNDTANVVWVVPATGGGANITGYKVTVSPATGVTGATTRSVGSATTSFNFNGLSPSIAYRFTVVAVNANGDSPASLPSNAVTINPAPTPPAPPTSAQAFWSEPDNAVEIDWTAPSGVSVDHYQVEARQGGTVVLTDSTSGTYLDIDRCLLGTPQPCLQPGTYTFHVSTVDTNGLESNAAITNPVTVPTP